MAPRKIEPRLRVNPPQSSASPRMQAQPSRALGGYSSNFNIAPTESNFVAMALGHLSPSLASLGKNLDEVMGRQSQEDAAKGASAAVGVKTKEDAEKVQRELGNRRATQDGFLSQLGRSTGQTISQEALDKVQRGELSAAGALKYVQQQLQGWEIDDAAFMREALPGITEGIARAEEYERKQKIAAFQDTNRTSARSNLSQLWQNLANNGDYDWQTEYQKIRGDLKATGMQGEFNKMAFDSLVDVALETKNHALLDLAKTRRDEGRIPSMSDSVEGGSDTVLRAVRALNALEEDEEQKILKQHAEMVKGTRVKVFNDLLDFQGTEGELQALETKMLRDNASLGPDARDAVLSEFRSLRERRERGYADNAEQFSRGAVLDAAKGQFMSDDDMLQAVTDRRLTVQAYRSLADMKQDSLQPIYKAVLAQTEESMAHFLGDSDPATAGVQQAAFEMVGADGKTVKAVLSREEFKFFESDLLEAMQDHVKTFGGDLKDPKQRKVLNEDLKGIAGDMLKQRYGRELKTWEEMSRISLDRSEMTRMTADLYAEHGAQVRTYVQYETLDGNPAKALQVINTAKDPAVKAELLKIFNEQVKVRNWIRIEKEQEPKRIKEAVDAIKHARLQKQADEQSATVAPGTGTLPLRTKTWRGLP